MNTNAYEIIDHTYDVVVLGAGVAASVLLPEEES